MRRIVAALLLMLCPLSTCPAQWSTFFAQNRSTRCVDGPVASMVLRLDALTVAGTYCLNRITFPSWVSSVGTNTATPKSDGGVPPICIANSFGDVPGINFAYNSAAYMTLTNPVPFGTSTTIMTVVAVPYTSPVIAFPLLSGGSGSLNYSIQSDGGSQAISVYTGTTMTAFAQGATGMLGPNIYQSNVTYTNLGNGYGTAAFRLNKAVDWTMNIHPYVTSGITTIGKDNLGHLQGATIGAIYVFSPALSPADVQSWEVTLSCKYPGA